MALFQRGPSVSLACALLSSICTCLMNDIAAFHSSPGATGLVFGSRRFHNLIPRTSSVLTLREPAQLDRARLEKGPCWHMAHAGEEKKVYDLVVVGGGPTGLTAALTAANAGRSVCLVDKTPRGQVMFSGPTGLFSKALRDAAKKVKVRTLREMGLRDTSIWKQVQDMTVDILNDSGQKNLLAVDASRLPYYRGRATLLPSDGSGESTLVVVEDPDTQAPVPAGQRRRPSVLQVKAKKVLIATGSRPYRLPHVPYNGETIFDSDSIRALAFLPREITIVGSGIIAIEFAKIFNVLECHVTLVVRSTSFVGALGRIGIDKAIAFALQRDLMKSGVKILFDAEVDEVVEGGTEQGSRTPMTLNIKRSSNKQHLCSITSDVLMTATGREPNSLNLGLEAASVKMDKNHVIEVNGDLETNVPGVYAAGDVVGMPSLASTGIEQAQAAVTRMFKLDDMSEGTWMYLPPRVGKDPKSLMSSPLQYPVGIWTLPEIGFIGRTKERALADGWKSVGEGIAYYGETIRGRVQGVETGLMKIVFSKPDGKILGVHIFGEDACELVHYATALAQSGKTVRQVLGTTFAAVTFHQLFSIAAARGVEILESDAWADILGQIGGEASVRISVSRMLEGLGEAGMNESDLDEVDALLKRDLDYISDLDVEIAQAQAVLRKYRIPPKYRLYTALKEQFDPALGEEVVRQRALNMFSSLDRDGSGSIDEAEMLQGLRDRGLVLSDDACRDLIASESASGEIRFDQFLHIIQSLQTGLFGEAQAKGAVSVGRRG
jgi:NAD(P) transhydrogenase